MAEAPTFKRKLRVTGLQQISSGVNAAKGTEWKLFKVTAFDEAGAQVPVELKTFSDSCPINELVEYEVEQQHHEKYGTSYLLKPPKRNLGAAVDELRQRVAALEQRVSQLAGVAGAAPPPAPSSQPQSQPAPAPAAAPAPAPAGWPAPGGTPSGPDPSAPPPAW